MPHHPIPSRGARPSSPRAAAAVIVSAVAILFAPSLATAAGAVISSAQDPGPRHAEAKRLLAASPEGDARRGMRICLELNDVPAVELLLDTLALEVGRGLPPGHYRDVSWEGLVGITDHYARLRVEEELKKSKSEWVRQWCAELLGIYGNADFGASLKRALSDKHIGVRRSAARSLGQIGAVDAVGALTKLVKHKDEMLRANAIESVARIDLERYSPTLLDAAAKDKDAGVRCALLAVAAELHTDDAETLATAALHDDDWRPRVQAVEILGTIRTKTSVDALLTAFDDGRPVVVARGRESLETLTGLQHLNANAWRRWWSDNRATFSFPAGTGQRADGGGDRSVATYYGIKLESDHVAFLIDKSVAMREQLTSRGKSKDDAALEELDLVLGQLFGRLTFNLFAYNLEVDPFEKHAIELTEKTAKKARDFIQSVNLSGRKDIWQVLEAVLADPTIDTAYLLSSGEPDTGTYVHWNRITFHLKNENRFRKLRIHSIAYSDSQWNRDQLENISKATGGEFRWFE